MTDKDRATPSINDAIAESKGTAAPAVTFDNCSRVEGPFFHGTRIGFEIGEVLAIGHRSNYHEGRVSNHLYFAALLEPAIWGAELATALTGSEGRGRVYVVEPTGPFEDDPNVTNKRFPGNVTRSYRTRHPLRIVDEVSDWEGHAPEDLQRMVEHIASLRDQGLDVIED
jgi:rifampin ADP-ribosylating transferase